jgi:hypothetical protein
MNNNKSDKDDWWWMIVVTAIAVAIVIGVKPVGKNGKNMTPMP